MEIIIGIARLLTIVLILCLLIYFIENKSFKRIRPLKNQIINSHESSDIKLAFHKQMRLNDNFKYHLKCLDTNLYDKALIKHSYRYVNKTMNQELRDLISCTGDYSGRLSIYTLEELEKETEIKRKSLLSEILDSKDIERYKRSQRPYNN